MAEYLHRLVQQLYQLRRERGDFTCSGKGLGITHLQQIGKFTDRILYFQPVQIGIGGYFTGIFNGHMGMCLHISGNDRLQRLGSRHIPGCISNGKANRLQLRHLFAAIVL
ncbi:hypothetical protein D3C80_1712180 [compost metagenome]